MGADVSVRLRAPFASIKSSRGMLVESPMKAIRRPSGEKLGYSAPPLVVRRREELRSAFTT